MRAGVLLAAGFGAVAGGAAGWLAASARLPDAATSSGESPAHAARDDGADLRTLSTRIERLQRSLDAAVTSIDRLAARAPDGSTSGAQAAADVPASRPGRADPAPEAPRRVSRANEWDQLTDDDLEMEADERHRASTDHSGAVQRYRALLARGGTALQVRRWSRRLGDCLSRLGRDAAACEAYQVAYEASTDEDDGERVVALRGLVRGSTPDRALAWIDAELRSGAAEEFALELHQHAADAARRGELADRERAELTWLVEHFADREPLFGWKKRLANLAVR